MLTDRFGFRIQSVDFEIELSEWGQEDCRLIGCAFATFVRKRKTGNAAVDAWRKQYSQLDVLFSEVEGEGASDKTSRSDFFLVFYYSNGLLFQISRNSW